MRDDEPADAVHDLFAETLFGDTPLGRSVLGTVESIEGLTPRRRRRLVPQPVRRCPRSWSTAAGRVDHAPGARPGHGGLRRPAVRRRAARRRCGRGEPAPDAAGAPTGLLHRQHRADPPAARRTGAGPARRAALRGGGARDRGRRRDELAAVPGDPGEARAGLQRRLGADPLRRHRGRSPSTPAARPKRVPEVLRLIREELARVAADGHHRRGGRPRPRSAQGRPGPGPRGHRLPDEPARQERAVLRRVPARAGGPGPARRGRPRTRSARSPPSCSRRPTCLAVVGPYRESDLDRL